MIADITHAEKGVYGVRFLRVLGGEWSKRLRYYYEEEELEPVEG